MPGKLLSSPSTECSGRGNGAGEDLGNGRVGGMESSKGNWEEGPKGTRKREGMLSQPDGEEGVLRKWKATMVLKMLETMEQGQGQRNHGIGVGHSF